MKSRGAWRARLPVIGVVVACVTGVCVAITGAANPVSAMQFLLPGHWVFNAGLQSVFHVDGATASVDAQARVPGDPGSQVVAGETSGFVVGDGRITEFGKSSLSVEESTSPPSKEVPAGIETAGGPYLVYRAAGKVVRLGDPAAVIPVGGPVGDPVATDDGTLWLPRTKSRLLCRLPKGAERVSCPVLLPEGHEGALTVVGDRPVFVDTSADLLHLVENDGLGAGHKLGVDVPNGARLAPTDVAGRVAILDGNRMHLVDAGLDPARAPAKPVTVPLPAGDYAGPVSTGSAVAVVDRKTDTLSTYDSKGQRKSTTTMPPESGDPRLTRGEDDRVYVDGAQGEHVLVVDTDGAVTEVPVTGEDGDKERERERDPTSDQPAAPPAEPEPPAPPARDPAPRPEPKPDQERDEKPAPPPEVPASPPGAPTGVSATAGNATATVNWGPAPDNRSAITGYTVSWPGGSTRVAGGARAATVNGLANGTSYVFTVTATNAVGTGPGASANPVTPAAPVAPASAPLNVNAVYNTDTRDAVLTWNPPANMGGGTFVHYLVGVTGEADRTFTGTSATFDAIQTGGTLTFTVHAVTQAPGGQLLTGAPGTDTAQGNPTEEDPPAGNPSVTASRGADSESDACVPPDCGWIHVVMTGFAPNTQYTITGCSSEWDCDFSEPSRFTTDASGAVTFEDIRFDGGGQMVWVTVQGPSGPPLESNHFRWEDR